MSHPAVPWCSCWDCLHAMRKIVPPLPIADRPMPPATVDIRREAFAWPEGHSIYIPTWRCPKGHEQHFAVASTYGTAAQHAPATAYCLTCFNEWAAERFPTSPVEREKTHG